MEAELLAARHLRLGEIDGAEIKAAEVLADNRAFGRLHVHLWRRFRIRSGHQS